MLERGIMMSKNEKLKKIETLIEKIINNAIEEYTSQFDENSGMFIDDWKNGYKGTIVRGDGKILKYIPYADFKNLYSNLRNDLYKATNEQLDKILKYLEEESAYTNYNDLDRENYDLDEIEEEYI